MLSNELFDYFIFSFFLGLGVGDLVLVWVIYFNIEFLRSGVFFLFFMEIFRDVVGFFCICFVFMGRGSMGFFFGICFMLVFGSYLLG